MQYKNIRKIYYIIIMSLLFTVLYSLFPNSSFSGWKKESDNDIFTLVDLFHRLFYSVVIQTTLGFSELYPDNLLLRFITMIQALSTIFIIII